MENWCSIYVHYNGEFDDSSNYVGGQERLIYVPSTNISVNYLRSNIQQIFDAEYIFGEYNLYYTSRSRSGRIVKSLLTTDLELQRLCALHLESNIFVIMKGGATVGNLQRQPSPYRPFISSMSPPPNQYFSPTADDLQRFGSSMYFGASSNTNYDSYGQGLFNSFAHGSASGSGSQHFDLNEEPLVEENEEEEEHETEIGGGGHVVLDDDDEADLDEESSDSDDESFRDDSNFRLNCTVAEFSAWIRNAGGMSAFISNLMPTHPLPEGCEVNAELNNWLLPIREGETSHSPVVKDVSAILETELSLNSLFWSKDELFIAVALWHMENRQEFKVRRSDHERVEYVCKRSANCSFVIRANCRSKCWIVRKFVPNHNCQINLPGVGVRSIRSKAAAAYFARRMRRYGAISKPREIMVELQRSFGIQTSYGIALRARNAAISILYGTIAESFENLPQYLEVLEQYNPGTVTSLDLEADGTFKHVFVALGVSRSAFESNLLRPVIVVDGTHLKGRNKGIMFVAVTKDGNENVFPLAIGVGPIENDESWRWFIARLRNSFQLTSDALIVSDQHISISNAVSDIFPGTTHGLCYYHLQNELTGYGPGIVKLYQRAAYAYRGVEFRQAMDRINEGNLVAFEKLITVGPKKWAKSQCPVNRYSFLTTNAAEVFNARLLDTRRLPICSIIDSYRSIVEKWFDERRAKAAAREDQLTEEAVQKVVPLREISYTYSVVKISGSKFKVSDDEQTWLVDLNSRTCQCREWQLDLIPCSHGIAAIRTNGENLYDYIHDYYKTNNLRLIYGGSVHSLPPQHEWQVSNQAQSIKVLPPNITRRAGRPRNSRRPSGAEHSRVSTSRRRSNKRCSVCQSENHTRRLCPERAPNT